MLLVKNNVYFAHRYVTKQPGIAEQPNVVGTSIAPTPRASSLESPNQLGESLAEKNIKQQGPVILVDEDMTFDDPSPVQQEINVETNQVS